MGVQERREREKLQRKKEIIKPRQIIMYILREDFSISYPSIGEKLGGRDHTTVIHSCVKIKREIKYDLTQLYLGIESVLLNWINAYSFDVTIQSIF